MELRRSKLQFACVALFAAVSLSACTQSGNFVEKAAPRHINNSVKFSAAAYGVAASPRLTTSRTVRKGGGRRQLGKPYKVRGKWYRPRLEPDYDRRGEASWYGPNFHGRLTANGEIYDQFALSAAHPTFPLPSYARVTNVKNGKSIVVRVNDRGPFHDRRIIDLSKRAADMLDYKKQGIGNVRVQYVGAAPLHGLDAAYLEASFREELPTIAALGRSQLEQDRAGAERQMTREVDIRSTASVPRVEETEVAAVQPHAAASTPQAEAESGFDSFSEAVSKIWTVPDDGSTLALRMRQLNAEHLR